MKNAVWKKFINGNEENVINQLSPEIYLSWKRCRDWQINYQQISNYDILPSNRFNELLQAHEDFVRISKIVLQYIVNFLKDSEHLVLVSDKDGVILITMGNPTFLNKVQKISLSSGTNWREDIKGTNTVGTVLFEKSPIVVPGWQHYVQPIQFINCWGAPIFYPDKTIAGVLNISSASFHNSDQMLTLAIMGARMIEQNLQINDLERKCCNNQQSKRAFEEIISTGIASLNENGFIININKAEALKLGYDSKDMIGKHFSEVIAGRITPILKKMDSNNSGTEKWMDESGWIGRSPQTRAILKLAIKASRTDSTIFIQGESGTGKENIARIIHNQSARRNKPFIAINCAAIPSTLIESELFGYAEGAFSGARRGGQAGKFELAQGGTIFLDEIGDMPFSVQSVLLRVLQTREVYRIGEGKARPVDVRVIAATNRNCSEMVEKKQFRLDLYYRLKVICIEISPLRERLEDIYDLVPYFLDKFRCTFKKQEVQINEGIYKYFLSYHWPGNVRELENCIESMVALTDGPMITYELLPKELKNTEIMQAAKSRGTLTLHTEKTERAIILNALEQTKWNASGAARLLGIGRATLHRKLNKYNIVRPVNTGFR